MLLWTLQSTHMTIYFIMQYFNWSILFPSTLGLAVFKCLTGKPLWEYIQKLDKKDLIVSWKYEWLLKFKMKNAIFADYSRRLIQHPQHHTAILLQ